jgi:hypothetical protein
VCCFLLWVSVVSCSFDVTVEDNQAPAITCPSAITVGNDDGTCGAVVSYTAPSGSDNCPSPTTMQDAGLAPDALFPIGTTSNTFNVTDTSGNSGMLRLRLRLWLRLLFWFVLYVCDIDMLVCFLQ